MLRARMSSAQVDLPMPTPPVKPRSFMIKARNAVRPLPATAASQGSHSESGSRIQCAIEQEVVCEPRWIIHPKIAIDRSGGHKILPNPQIQRSLNSVDLVSLAE